jgi:membrane-associated phospholipid phosphatase
VEGFYLQAILIYQQEVKLDTLTQGGVNWIMAVQSLGAWLQAPMEFFSFLGTENFFLLVLPLLYWSIDAKVGIQIGFILITSNYFNEVFKLLFAGPRPYWVSDRIIPLAAESTFGIPSGHAQNAVSVWGTIAASYRNRWGWMIAFALMFLIGFSRWYLGVHYWQDVIVGWLIGGILLWSFMRFWNPIEAWLRQKTFATQVWLAFSVSMLFIALGAFSAGRLDSYTFPEAWRDNALRASKELPAPVSMEGFFTSAGTFFGLAAGAAWITSRGGYQAEGPLEKRALRFVIGLIGIIILWRGLALIFPDQADLVSYAFRYLRYSLVGFWVSAGAPWLFFRFKLANAKM